MNKFIELTKELDRLNGMLPAGEDTYSAIPVYEDIPLLPHLVTISAGAEDGVFELDVLLEWLRAFQPQELSESSEVWEAIAPVEVPASEILQAMEAKAEDERWDFLERDIRYVLFFP